MRSAPVLAAAFALLATTSLGLLPSCRRETPPPPPPAAPATGWQMDDATATATALVEALADDKWVQEFTQANGRKPTVQVGAIDDRSADHVPVDDLARAFAEALAGSGRVASAAEGQAADGTLTAVVGLRTAGSDRLFTIDARVADAAGDVKWVGGIQRPRQDGTPAPTPVQPPR